MIFVNKMLFALALFGSTFQMHASSSDACFSEEAAPSLDVEKFFTLTIKFSCCIYKAMQLQAYSHEEIIEISDLIAAELKEIRSWEPDDSTMLQISTELSRQAHSEQKPLFSMTREYLIFISLHFPDKTEIVENIQMILDPILNKLAEKSA